MRMRVWVGKFYSLLLYIVLRVLFRNALRPVPIKINLELWLIETLGKATWTVDQPVARPLPTRDKTKTE
jgi:hypothetical protein